LLGRFDDPALRNRLFDLAHERTELLAVFGLSNRGKRSAQELDVVLLQDSRVAKLGGQIQASLSAKRRKESVGLFSVDDALTEVDVEGFDVESVGHSRVGHDGGGVGVDQDNFMTLFLEALAGLSSRIIELRRLTDDDGTGADNKDLHSKEISYPARRPFLGRKIKNQIRSVEKTLNISTMELNSHSVKIKGVLVTNMIQTNGSKFLSGSSLGQSVH